MTTSRTVLSKTVLALAALTLLAACGKQTPLERPAPMFGGARPNEPSQPGSLQESIDPASSSATTRQTRIPGTNPDPFSGPSGPGFPNSGTLRD